MPRDRERRSVPPLAPGPGAVDEVASRVGRAAVASLHEGLALHPKPGLVTPRSPGAHRDMDARTFFASLLSLRGYYREVARAGARGAPFAALRSLAAGAEERMLGATGGVNTHRGAIFTLGLLSAAGARIEASGEACRPGALREEVHRGYGRAVRTELPPSPGSHGSLARRRHGAGGARDEAAEGFPHVFEVGLPALEESLARGSPRAAAAVQCLLSLVAALPDTNLLYRAGPEGLRFATARARGFLGAGGVRSPGWESRLLEIDRDFVARGLSPGGSADLLAASLLVHRLCRRRADQGRP